MDIKGRFRNYFRRTGLGKTISENCRNTFVIMIDDEATTEGIGDPDRESRPTTRQVDRQFPRPSGSTGKEDGFFKSFCARERAHSAQVLAPCR